MRTPDGPEHTSDVRGHLKRRGDRRARLLCALLGCCWYVTPRVPWAYRAPFMSVLGCYFYAVSWASVTRVLAPRWCANLLWFTRWPGYNLRRRVFVIRLCGLCAYVGALCKYTVVGKGEAIEFGVAGVVWLLAGALVFLSECRLRWYRRRPQSTIKARPWNEDTFVCNLWPLFLSAVMGALPLPV